MKFADGFLAEDDSTNQKTVVSVVPPEIMPSADMSEVLTPLPSKIAKYPKYSTTEQIVAEWIDGKPIYQKCVSINIASDTSSEAITSGVATNCDRIVGIRAIQRISDTTTMESPVISENGYYSRVRGNIDNGNINLFHKCTISTWIGSFTDIIVTIQYTKTTD